MLAHQNYCLKAKEKFDGKEGRSFFRKILGHSKIGKEGPFKGSLTNVIDPCDSFIETKC